MGVWSEAQLLQAMVAGLVQGKTWEYGTDTGWKGKETVWEMVTRLDIDRIQPRRI